MAIETQRRRARLRGCILLLAAVCFGSGCGPTEKPAPENQLREIVLREIAPEHDGEGLFDRPRVPHRQVLARLREAAHEPGIKGLLLDVGSFGGAWARAAELRAALARVREANKPVHCHFESADNVAYALMASACDRISMAPSGMLDLVGVHAQFVYARELLDRIGVSADLIQVGRYKGAADPLTHSEMPRETAETLGALLDDLQASLRKAVEARSGGLDFEAILAQGPHTARGALRLGLVDAITFDDEARARAKEAAGAQHVERLSDEPEQEHTGLLSLLRALLGDERGDRVRGERIALAYLTGTIVDQEEAGGSGVSAGPFVTAMRRFADDKDVRALVLRIDSPGGSASASDRMWHAVKRVAKRKPVIVSIGDMAASGGYYVASAATEIYAQDESLVGSIGVVGGKIVAKELSERIGLHVVELQRGPHAGWTSPVSPWNASERAAIEKALHETYELFLSRVSLGRRLEGEKLEAMAEGRLMTGGRAREGGLVDTAGGLEAALARARAQATLPEDATVEIWPRRQPLLQRLSRVLSGAEARSSAAHAMMRVLGASGLPAALVLGERGPFAALPYSIELR